MAIAFYTIQHNYIPTFLARKKGKWQQLTFFGVCAAGVWSD